VEVGSNLRIGGRRGDGNCTSSIIREGSLEGEGVGMEGWRGL